MASPESWPGKFLYFSPSHYVCLFFFLEFLRCFKPICNPQPEKRPVGRPPKRKRSETMVDIEHTGTENSTNSDEINDQLVDLTSEEPATMDLTRKGRGHYRSYSLQFKMSVVAEVVTTPLSVVAEKYSIARSTIASWETQLRREKTTRCPDTLKGAHLRSGSGRTLSYPKEVDEEIHEWILVRRDAHLPVSRELIKTKARQLIKSYNPNFTASSGWLQKFMIRHSLSLRSKTSISQKLPVQLENKIECFLNEVRILRSNCLYPVENIINMDETPMYFDMVPSKTVSKKGVSEVRICSSGAEKRRLTVVLSCTASGKMLPSLAIFKGKRKLQFKPPKDVHVAVQQKGWMDTDLMFRWLKAIVLPYTKGRKTLLVMDSFSAHEDTKLLEKAKAENIDIVVIPGGCTSKIQPLDVCLNKPFKSILRRKWVEFIDSQVATDLNPEKLTAASKQKCCEWIREGVDYIQDHEEMVKKAFLVCGISNALDGSQNHLISCSKQLPNLELPYLDESNNPFLDDEDQGDASDSDASEGWW